MISSSACLFSLMPQGGFVIRAPSGALWDDVDLSSGEWVEYDERAGESVSVMGLEWEFQVYRPKK